VPVVPTDALLDKPGHHGRIVGAVVLQELLQRHHLRVEDGRQLLDANRTRDPAAVMILMLCFLLLKLLLPPPPHLGHQLIRAALHRAVPQRAAEAAV